MRAYIHFPARRVAVLALLGFLVLTGGCTTFNHDWKKAAKQSTSPESFEGRWQGTWASDVTHHTDKLRCVVTKQDDGSFKARFHAKYHTVMSFGYTVPLKVEGTTNGIKFNGEANLGWLAGGLYQYDGHADATHYFSTYSCKYDHGTFQMERP